MNAYFTASQIINAITDFVFDINIVSSGAGLDIITFIFIVLCIGWVIHSLANKEP